MATSFSTGVSSSIAILSRTSSKRASRGSMVIMCVTKPVPIGLRIKSYDHNEIKVFEDKLNGIICYKDRNGEIICEGYDEGPRFSQPISSEDAERVGLLQRCWLHECDEKELPKF
ncbi:uncharacterized protein LOC125205159 [Salvia hispanica]|uniref:uncharacterized protein LOC125205159 n=1 Tax=Salvia hispanica TaxID=49212 RepID=UPI0020097267|nr:uncharacterized protein LOC125205159 [Salvia hispanica]